MTVVYALIAISIIIFIHELGHFLAAKKVGVRVERFSIGFDPSFRGRKLRVFSFERGDTEYVLGAIPFGGYVKLAGEMIPESAADAQKAPAPDELLAKSPSQRALIFVAGSVMNIISGFIFFMVCFTLGVSFTGPDIGNSIPGTPAWDAGILPGDRVVAVNGEDVADFTEMRVGIALSERGQPLQVRVARPSPDGGEENLDFTVTPRWRGNGFNEIGVVPAISSVAEPPERGSSFEKAGLRGGDRVLGAELGGVHLPVESFSAVVDALQTYVNLRQREPIRLLVDRTGGEQWLETTPEPEEGGEPRPRLGVMPGAGTFVRAVRGNSGAAKLFQPRDRLLSVAGKTVGDVHWLQIIEAWPGQDGKIELEIQSHEGEARTVAVDRDDFLKWDLRGDIYWDHHALEVAELQGDSPLAAAGLSAGDLLTDVNGEACYSLDDLGEMLTRSTAPTVSLKVQGSKGPRTVEVSLDALENLDDITWQSMPPLAAMVRDGPADKAGIVPGSRILSLGGERLHSWDAMLQKVLSSEPGEEVAASWLDPTGKENSGNIRLEITPLKAVTLPFTYSKKTIQASPVESFGLGARRTLLVIKQVFLTVRSLLRQDVSAKHLAGPVGIVHQFTIVVERGDFSMLLFWLALISVNLGLFNLFPFPILDGGHLLFLAIEKVKGSPVDVRIQEWAVNVAFIMIICLALFVTFNDFRRLFE